MDIEEKWEESAFMSSQRDSRKRNKNLRWCPGVYKPTDGYCDIWTYVFLETTPYSTFKELFDSGDVVFNFEKYEKRRKEGNDKV